MIYEQRCMFCGCLLSDNPMLRVMGKIDGLQSEFCEDCIEKHYEEITGRDDDSRADEDEAV